MSVFIAARGHWPTLGAACAIHRLVQSSDQPICGCALQEPWKGFEDDVRRKRIFTATNVYCDAPAASANRRFNLIFRFGSAAVCPVKLHASLAASQVKGCSRVGEATNG